MFSSCKCLQCGWQYNTLVALIVNVLVSTLYLSSKIYPHSMRRFSLSYENKMEKFLTFSKGKSAHITSEIEKLRDKIFTSNFYKNNLFLADERKSESLTICA